MKKVLILFGGNSFEHEISCMSVNFIKENIDTNIFKFELVGIDKKNNWFIVNKKNIIDNDWTKKNNVKINNIIKYIKKFDIIFPVIHGNTVEDGKLQGLFELYNIKYVGCNSYSSLICYDKLLTKLILEKFNIPQVPYTIYRDNLDIDKISYPVIIKPCKCGSSLGINIANNKKELESHIKEAKKYDNNILIEQYLENKRELECAILENNGSIITSDIGEIINNQHFYDFDAKYKTKIDTEISNIDLNIKKEIKEYSLKIFKILNCKDLSRIDFFYDLKEKKLYFNEINTIPGFTKISMYPKLLYNIDITPKKLITILLST